MFSFKDSACQNVNLKHHCYVMDPFCQPNTTEKPSDNLAIHVVTGGLIALVTFVLFCALLYHQRKKLKRSKGMHDNVCSHFHFPFLWYNFIASGYGIPFLWFIC